MADQREPAPTRVALTVWAAALAAYVVAVAGRTSLGVAGPQAADRFSVSASQLALFVVVQLAVYAGAQVPVGMVLDRLGSRRVIAGGAVLLAGGQLMLALVETLPLALVARVLVGLGDATAFVSVLRLVPAWFPVRRVPLVTQLTGIVGQLGQIISAVPFMALLLATSWQTAFVSLAVSGVLMAFLVALVVRDRPGAERSTARARPPRGSLRTVLREPGTWLGFWTHFLGLFPTNTFMLLWGVPFLTSGQGVPARTAGALLSVGALAGIVIGPVAGELVARHPLRRSWLVLGYCALTVAAWAGVLVPAGPRPVWHLALLVVVLAGSGAASNIGFDFARTSVPPARLGTATGVVNAGGFVASLVSVLLVGLVLDLVRPGGDYELADFRLAFSAQVVLWLVGVTGVLLARRATRRRMAAEGVVVLPVRTVVARWRRRRRGHRP